MIINISSSSDFAYEVQKKDQSLFTLWSAVIKEKTQRILNSLQLFLFTGFIWMFSRQDQTISKHKKYSHLVKSWLGLLRFLGIGTSHPEWSYRISRGHLATPPVGSTPTTRVSLSVASSILGLVLKGGERHLGMVLMPATELDTGLPATAGTVGLTVITGTKSTWSIIPREDENC